jgi:hypothetical protein
VLGEDRRGGENKGMDFLLDGQDWKGLTEGDTSWRASRILQHTGSRAFLTEGTAHAKAQRHKGSCIKRYILELSRHPVIPKTTFLTSFCCHLDLANTEDAQAARLP